MQFLEEYPWLVPGAVLAVAVGIAVRDRVAAWLGTTPPVALVLVVSLGVNLAATLAPPGFTRATRVVPPGTCDLSRFGLAPLDQLLAPSDVTGNVLGFIPLGLAIGLLPRSRRSALVLAGAVALPFLIEAIQLVVEPLGRVCQSGDVIDNLSGLVIGLAAALVVRRLWPGPWRSGVRDPGAR